MDSKQSFILYKSFYTPTKCLSLEQKGMLYDAIFQYQIEGIEPEPTSEILMAFLFFKNQFDLDEKKWGDVLEKRKKAGQMGGIAKAKKAKGKSEKQKVANVASAKSAKQKVANVPVNENGNVNVNENGNVNVNEKENGKEGTGEKVFSLFEKIRDDWHRRFLEVVGVGYDWNGTEVKHLKQLIEKFKKLVKQKNQVSRYSESMDNQVFETWTYFMNKLPQWYSERPDLKIINSKFNAIIAQIKNGNGASQDFASEFEKLRNLRQQEKQ